METDVEYANISLVQRQKLNSYLTSFLELGRVMRQIKELKNLCRQFGVKRQQVPKQNFARIDSWPLFIATLVDLAEKSA